MRRIKSLNHCKPVAADSPHLKRSGSRWAAAIPRMPNLPVALCMCAGNRVYPLCLPLVQLYAHGAAAAVFHVLHLPWRGQRACAAEPDWLPASSAPGKLPEQEVAPGRTRGLACNLAVLQPGRPCWLELTPHTPLLCCSL